MNQPPIPADSRVFPLQTKAAKIRWKDLAIPANQVNWPALTAYGLIAAGFIVVDFDDLASRCAFENGNFRFFLEQDGWTLQQYLATVPSVKTPHGYHSFFAEDAQICQGQGFPFKDGQSSFVDIRAQGRGYVVGPGSTFKSDRANAAKHPNEPVGSILQYEPLYKRWPATLPSLRSILPTLYAIVTKKECSLHAIPPQPVPAEISSNGIVFRESIKKPAISSPFDGRDNWRPAKWEDGLLELRNAKEGQRHSIAAGVDRFLWRYSNKSTYQTRENEFITAAEACGLKPDEIAHILRDFVGAKVEAEQKAAASGLMQYAAPTAQYLAAPKTEKPVSAVPAAPEEVQFIMNGKGDKIVQCEENLRTAIRNGLIDVSDLCIDFRGDLVHIPSREASRNGQMSAHCAQYEATAVLVGRIDRFFGGSMQTRSKFLPIAVDEIGQVATESLAPEFFAAITSPGPTKPVSDLVARMGIDATPQIIRWIEACLLQALRRMLKPASPLENILLLWGPQRTHKSTFVPSLFDPSYVSAETGEYKDDWSYTDTLSCDLKDEQIVGQRVKSKFALEIPELTAFRRTKDVGALRDVITRTHDSYRAPYAKQPEKQPRTCTFIGTSNEEPELGDQYGNRRFCVVKVARTIDTSWICENRVEIWRGLYQTLKACPKKAVLSVEEQAEKEKSLETNSFLAIPFFAEICDALKSLSDSTSNEVLPLTDILRELTTEKDGPHLPNTDYLRRAVADILRHLHAQRRPGRYPTYVFGDLQRSTLKAWMDTDGKEPAEDSEQQLMRLKAENERLRNQLAAMQNSITAPLPESAPAAYTTPDAPKNVSPIAPAVDRYSPFATIDRIMIWFYRICAEYAVTVPAHRKISESTTWKGCLDAINRMIKDCANAPGPEMAKNEIIGELKTAQNEVKDLIK